MDLNQLLSHHQQAQMAAQSGSTQERRDWSRECAAFYAEQIARVRRALGRNDPFTWTQGGGGIATHG